ncbi:hypothetical protein ACFYTS_36400 [Nocardia sp. NPDC004151]|uniref:hypothetical protein n=1 Tax=Nocardia sp. NPDC004151 TaxID=3364304 RepID=UPI00368C8872
MTEPWRAVATAILYKSQFAPALNDAEAHRTAEWLVRKPLWDLTVEEQHRALLDALDSRAPLDTVVQAPFSEAEKRSFFIRIVAELDTMRPWPDRPYHEIPLEQWTDFVDLTPLARISLAWTDLQPLLGKMFRKPPGYNRELLLLRLNSGAEVAFISPGWPPEPATALVSRTPNADAPAIIRELLTSAPINPAEVTLLPTLPPPPAPYETTPLRPEFAGEHLPGNTRWNGTHVHYLTPTERAPYKLAIANGLLYNSQGTPFDTTTANTLWTPRGGRAIFVMDTTGDIYSSPRHILGQFHHSSFLSGAPVSAAGELAAKDGHLHLISDHSTHYRPPRRITRQLLDNLRRHGIQIADKQVEYHMPPDIDLTAER